MTLDIRQVRRLRHRRMRHRKSRIPAASQVVPTAPDAPTLNPPINVAVNGFTLSVQPVAEATDYEFQVDPGTGFATQQDAAATSYDAVGALTTGEIITADTPYPYRVRARNAAGVSGWTISTVQTAVRPDGPGAASPFTNEDGFGLLLESGDPLLLEA